MHSWRSVPTDGSFELDVSDEQADLARLTNVLRVVVEVNERCWRGDDCEFCDGVRQGVGRIAEHTQQQSDLLEQRVCPSFALQPRTRTKLNRHRLCCGQRWSLLR